MLPLLISILSFIPQTPTQDQVDTWLAQRWTALVNAETTYAANHGGRYFQGKRTHLVNEPADGSLIAPDNLSAKPSDQTEAWAGFITLPATMPCILKIDVYRNAQGWGFVATVGVKVNGNWWVRSKDSGPEPWRTVAWQRVPALVLQSGM
jgi:hypothetical protein